MTRYHFLPVALLGALACLVTPVRLAAQDLALPDGWTARLDAPQQLVDGQELAPGEWRYVKMPPGWHMTTTASGVTVLPEQYTINGRWALEVELFLFPNPSSSEFGIVLASPLGVEHGDPDIRLVMRADGATALIAHSGRVSEVGVPWQPDTTGTLAHDGKGVIKYVLRAVHESGHLIFSVNGVERYAFSTGGGDHVAIPGFRLGPGLNVHISRYDVIEPLAPARVRNEK